MPFRARPSSESREGAAGRLRGGGASAAPLPRPCLRPALVRSHSVSGAPPPAGAQKRSVSFLLPVEGAPSRGRVAELAHSLRRLASGAGRAKPEKATKRILRQPVVHVYVRGASGLPTQRVPLAAVYRVSRDFRASSVS